VTHASARRLALIAAALLLCACAQPGAAPAPSPATAERPTEPPTVQPPTAEPPTAAPASVTPARADPTVGTTGAQGQPGAAPYELTLAPATIAVGEQLVATVVRTSITQGNCRFLAYDMTLKEVDGVGGVGGNAPYFTFDSPERLGPPAPATGVYTLTASLAGEATLVADIYGETDCGAGFSWATQHSNSVTITIGAPRQAYLPRILK
jgi:hypothetical protein